MCCVEFGELSNIYATSLDPKVVALSQIEQSKSGERRQNTPQLPASGIALKFIDSIFNMCIIRS